MAVMRRCLTPPSDRTDGCRPTGPVRAVGQDGGMGLTRAELEAARDRTVPDLVGPATKLLFVGINPGLWTAATQAHFARRGNRFYPALYRAGIVDRVIDASAGYSGDDRAHLLERGIGITNVVARATARADELTTAEYVAGATLLEQRVAAIRPVVVAILGLTAYRTGFRRPKARAGRQDETLGGAPLWVVPNPSGLNARARLDDLAAAYREVAVAAGIPVISPGGPGTAQACRESATPSCASRHRRSNWSPTLCGR